MEGWSRAAALHRNRLRFQASAAGVTAKARVIPMQSLPQGLKPAVLLTFSAGLKACSTQLPRTADPHPGYGKVRTFNPVAHSADHHPFVRGSMVTPIPLLTSG